MKRIINLLLFILLLSTQLFGSKSSEFEYLKSNISSLHKNFYNSNSKEECDKVFSALSSNIDSYDDSSYYFALLSYLALSNDSHTSLYAPDLGLQFKYYPLQLYFIGSEAYVLSGTADLKEYMGKEVIKINNYSIESIIEKSKAVIPHDNDVYLRLFLSNQLNNTAFLSFIKVANSLDDDVVLTFSDNTTIKLKPILITELKSKELISSVKQYSPYIYQGYYCAREIREDTLLISFNTCSEDPSYPISSFTSDIKSMLSKTKYKKIIVDLRYNGGGNSALFKPIIKLLKKQKCEKYCLIGEQTFSSAVLNAVSLKDDARFSLVGTPTGGSINHYGEIKSFILPESGWEVSYSAKYFKHSKKYDGSIRPDIEIKKDINSFIEGRDLEIEYCLK